MAYNDYSAPYGASAAGFSSPSIPTAPTAPGQRTARVGSTPRAAASPTLDAAIAPVINPQRQIMLQNMGLAPRGASNPTFAYRQATATLDAAAAPSNPVPAVNAPAATPAFKGVPYAPPQDNSAPVVSGSAPAATPAPTVAAATNTAITQPQRLSAKNGISDQVARQMYKVAMSQNPNDLAAGEQQFHETMAKYGVNGKALLDHWHGAPQTDFMTSPAVMKTTSTPYSMLGTDKSGGTPPPGMPTGQVNNVSIAPATFGPKPGYTALPTGSGIAPTARLDKNDQVYGQIRDDYQAPFGSNARDLAVAPILNHGPTPDQVAGAKAVLNSLPPTERERFNANVDAAKAAAQAPLAKVGLQNQGRETVAQTNADARRDATSTRATSNENVANTKAQSADSVAQTRANSAKEVQQLKNVGQADAAKLRTVIGGKAGDPITTQQKAFIMAFSKTAATDENLEPRKFEDRLAEAQKLMGAGAQGATTYSGGNGAQPITANNAAPAAQTASAQQAGDQVYQGFVYRQGADGQYHKVGPAQQ